MCFGPSTLGAGAKTRLESRIKKFMPHCICRHALPRFANMLGLAGQHPVVATQAQALADKLKHAIATSAWNGKWIRRAWLGPDVGWVGDIAGHDSGIFSAQIGWALYSEVFPGSSRQSKIMVESMTEQCRDGWPYGFAYRCNTSSPLLGSGTWPAINHPTIIGLAKSGYVPLAWDEFVSFAAMLDATVIRIHGHH